MFDIGAYCGIFTYELSKLVGLAGKVIAFEPDPLNVQLLRRNVERHKLMNVTIMQAAVSDRIGEAWFNSEGALGSALSAAIDRPSTGETTMVETTSFVQACAKFGTPAFVKIDAEGSEVEILSGAQDLISSHQIHFVLDTNHIRDGRDTSKSVESIFRACGYDAESSSAFGGLMTTWARRSIIEPAK